MTTALAPTPDIDAIEHVLVNGDLSKLTPAQRVSYYHRVCDSLGLNPLTKPFAYIPLNGKLVLYALKDCTEQLRNLRAISVTIAAREVVEDCYLVTARASFPAGRQDESLGAVSIAGLKGEARANAMMKAETKAKRRVTLSICGLGMLDETEVETITAPTGYTVEAPKQLEALNGKVAESGDARASDRRPVVAALDPSAADRAGSTPALATLPDDALYIRRIDMTDTRNPNIKKYLLTFSTGETASTIKGPLAAQAESWCQDRIPVRVETKPTKWGAELVSLHPVREANRDDHFAAMDDADVVL